MTGVDVLADVWELRRSQPADALQTAERWRDEAIHTGDDLALARALTVIAACHLRFNDYPAGLRAALQALPILEGGPVEDRARLFGELGHLEVQSGDHAAGVERLLAALALYQELGDVRSQASALNRIGVAFFSHGDLDDAMHAYERSLGLLAGLDEDLETAGCHNNLAKVLTARGRFEAALEHLRAARRGFEAVGERRGLGMTFHNAAVVSEQLGDVERAEEQLRTSIDHYVAGHHPHGSCEARTRLGRLLGADGRVAEALTLLNRAHRDAEAGGFADECVRAAEALADLNEAQGEPTEALRWLRHLRAAERALFDEASDRRLRGLQVRFQLERFERDSVTDPLTGLLNRRGLDAFLEGAVGRWDERGDDLGLLLFDLDDFKRVNDTFSHRTGDDVLRAVADLLRAGTRPSDVCVRFGGEEFVVLLPGCGIEEAVRVGDGLRLAIRSHPWDAIADGLAVTSSVGAAVLSEVPDPSALLLAADRAMYEAKHEGKDQVRANP